MNLNELIDNRGDPDARAVLADHRLARGEKPGRLGVELWIAADDADAADAAADADADAAADAAAADADADADLVRSLRKILTEDIDMKDGLKVLQLPGRYGYSVTLVGWVRRISGDEYELLNACTIARDGSYRLDGLQKLASDGPGKRGYQVTEPSKRPEEIHRLLVRRVLPADVEAWAGHCPRPAGWSE